MVNFGPQDVIATLYPHRRYRWLGTWHPRPYSTLTKGFSKALPSVGRTDDFQAVQKYRMQSVDGASYIYSDFRRRCRPRHFRRVTAAAVNLEQLFAGPTRTRHPMARENASSSPCKGHSPHVRLIWTDEGLMRPVVTDGLYVINIDGSAIEQMHDIASLQLQLTIKT